MSIKYIQKNKDGNWTISNSKSGKILRKATTQKEAIKIAGSTRSTEGIMIKRDNVWARANGWDTTLAASTTPPPKTDKKVVTKKTPTEINDDKQENELKTKNSPTKTKSTKATTFSKKMNDFTNKVKTSTSTMFKKKNEQKDNNKTQESDSPANEMENRPERFTKGFWFLILNFAIIGLVIGLAFLLGAYL